MKHLTTTPAIVVLAVLLGTACGLTVSLARVGMPVGEDEIHATLLEVNPDIAPLLADESSRPRVEVLQKTHDFGVMDFNGTGEHDFIFSNQGNRPLTLEKGETSCKCTLSDLEFDSVPPGEKAQVTLQWTAKDYRGAFRQTATIFTNDPEQPRIELTVTGRVIVSVRPDPEELHFTRISTEQPTHGQVRLYGYRQEPLKIVGPVRLSSSGVTPAEQFDVDCRPLEPDELAEEPDATGGYLLAVTVKPGLRSGAVRQTIFVETNVPDVPTVEIPISGTAGGNVTIEGTDWNRKTGELNIGVVGGDRSTVRTLRFSVDTPHSQEVRLELGAVFPDLLRVTLDQDSEQSRGVARGVLMIEIPKGSPSGSYLGPERERLGRITLETNHPKVPPIQILVRFAVAE